MTRLSLYLVQQSPVVVRKEMVHSHTYLAISIPFLPIY